MYENVTYMGKTLKEWRELLFNKYSLGELYQMMKKGINFMELCKTS